MCVSVHTCACASVCVCACLRVREHVQLIYIEKERKKITESPSEAPLRSLALPLISDSLALSLSFYSL